MSASKNSLLAATTLAALLTVNPGEIGYRQGRSRNRRETGAWTARKEERSITRKAALRVAAAEAEKTIDPKFLNRGHPRRRVLATIVNETTEAIIRPRGITVRKAAS